MVGAYAQDLGATDKLLLLLASMEAACQVKELDRSVDAGFRIPKGWNVSDLLGRSKGKAIRTPQGWELSDSGKELAALQKAAGNPSVERVAHYELTGGTANAAG